MNWLLFCVIILISFILLLIIRVSEISSRMKIYEEFTAKCVTQEDIAGYIYKKA